MNVPKVGFGKGFVNARGRRLSASAHLYPVNVSNGMPIISSKKPIMEKGAKGWPSKLKTRVSALGQKKAP